MMLTIKLVDIKTTISTTDFLKSFEEYDYARQLCFYWSALYWYFKNELGIDIEEYSPETYIIAIQNSNSAVRVFRIDEDVILSKQNKIINTISEILWHKENDKWDYKRQYYEGDGAESLLYEY